MQTITHTRTCAAIGDLVNQVVELTGLARSERDFAVWYALNTVAGELSAAHSKACIRCHWQVAS